MQLLHRSTLFRHRKKTKHRNYLWISLNGGYGNALSTNIERVASKLAIEKVAITQTTLEVHHNAIIQHFSPETLCYLLAAVHETPNNRIEPYIAFYEFEIKYRIVAAYEYRYWVHHTQASYTSHSKSTKFSLWGIVNSEFFFVSNDESRFFDESSHLSTIEQNTTDKINSIDGI